jgi:hypothetical protein
MTPFLTELEHQLRGAAEREAGAGRPRSRIDGHRRLWSLIQVAPVAVAVGVAVLVFVLGLVFLHRGHAHTGSTASTVPTPAASVLRIGAPAGPSRPLNGVVGSSIEPGTARVVAEGRDLHGGLPWGLETFRTTDGQTCMLAGREQSGRVGVIGEDGTFNDDGRFHPFTPYTVSAYCGETDGNNNAFINVSDPATATSGNDQDVVRDGCQPSSASLRGTHAKLCPAADERQLEYGLLGPDAVSVTYTAGRHTNTVPTGPDGAYIVVGPGVHAGSGGSVSDHLMPGMVTAVTYRDGSACRPRQVTVPGHGSLGCPPVGYLAPPHARVTAAEVRAPVTATLTTATRWCGSSSGHYIACDASIPAGYRALRGSAGMVLLQWSWIARVAASGSNSGYEYTIKGGPPCGGGQSSSGPIPARRDERIVQQSLGSSGCAQQDTISVEYRVNVGPGGANFASPPNPGHDGQPLVGSTTINVPR